MRRLVWLALLGAIACGRSTTRLSQQPAAAPSSPAITFEEVRAARKAGQLQRYERSLQLLASAPDLTTRGRAEALLGLFYLEQNRRADAVPMLQRAANDRPLIAPWMWLRIGDAESLMRVLRDAGKSTAAPIARVRLTTLLAQTGAAGTDDSFAQVAAIPVNETTEPELVAMARALARAGRIDLAAATRMRLLTEYPQGRFTEENYAAVAGLAPTPIDAMSRDDTLAMAKKLGGTEHFTEALDLLRRFSERAPAEAATDEYRDLRIRSLFRSRRYEQLLAIADDEPLRDPAIVLTRARAAWRADQSHEFLDALTRVERDFPRSPEATEAKLLRAKYYTTDDRKLDLAIDNLEQVIGAGATGSEGENLWTLGWTYFLASRYDDALRVFADYQRRFPDGDYLSNSLFWTAKIHDRLGRPAERDAAFDRLQAFYPYNYFSYRARELRQQSPVAPSEIANGNVFPDVDAQLAELRGRDPAVGLADELTWLELYADALPVMKSLADAHADNAGVAFALAELYTKAGETLRANGLLQRRFRTYIRHGGSNIPHRLWEMLYPLPYWPIIEREAARQKVDPYLLASIARQESIFEPSTVSNAGAVGIMQIMPEDAPRIAAAAGVSAPTREQLFDPAVNFAIGAAEYAQKRAAMNGIDMLAIAAYNAGTETIGRWLAATPLDDGDVFVESIPFNETRLYVKTVTRNRFEYRRIYENGTSQSTK